MTSTTFHDFSSDYLEGAHPRVLELLTQTNLEKTCGYGLDEYSERARNLVRELCAAPDAEVQFLIGGTQANQVMISCLLAPYQGVISAVSGHINTHEAGAIERFGHKVLTIPHVQGKVSAADVRTAFETWHLDKNRAHVVMPGALYVSQPTECGTMYSLAELEELSAVCRAYDAKFIIDGARLAYALGSPVNDATLSDLARLADAFTIGGTKCGALFGEAVVVPDPELIPHFHTLIKQHGALLAKGRIAALQFIALLEDGLYEQLGKQAVKLAFMLRDALVAKGYTVPFDSPTNQQYVLLDNERYEELSRRIGFAFFEVASPTTSIARFATSWASTREDVQALIDAL